MGASSGMALKALQWFIRGVQFCCAGLVLAIYSYFLATLHNHSLHISDSIRAVEGISGAGVLYTLLGLLLLCCLAGHMLASFFAIILDIAFAGAFIYVAYVNRHGAGSCKGYLDTPYGDGNGNAQATGNSNGFTVLPSYHTACRLQTASLAVSIIAIFFFFFSILMEFILVRHHRKEKRFGPSPQNNYTSGYGKQGGGGVFGRIFRRGTTKGNTTDPNALPEHTHPGQLDGRQSYATETTAVNNPYTAQPYTAEHVKPETGYGYQGQNGVNNFNNTATTGGHQNYRYDDGVYERA